MKRRDFMDRSTFSVVEHLHNKLHPEKLVFQVLKKLENGQEKVAHALSKQKCNTSWPSQDLAEKSSGSF